MAAASLKHKVCNGPTGMSACSGEKSFAVSAQRNCGLSVRHHAGTSSHKLKKSFFLYLLLA
jgi:hypothetical protein